MTRQYRTVSGARLKAMMQPPTWAIWLPNIPIYVTQVVSYFITARRGRFYWILEIALFLLVTTFAIWRTRRRRTLLYEADRTDRWLKQYRQEGDHLYGR